MSREIDLIGGFYRDEPWSAQDTVNWLPVKAQAEGARSPLKLRGAPGIVPLGGTVVDALRITGDAPDTLVGASYSYSYSVTGGTPPYSVGLASGSLPAGLSISTAGVVTGTATTEQVASFTVRATDAGSQFDTLDDQIVVVQAQEVEINQHTFSRDGLSSADVNVAIPGTPAVGDGVFVFAHTAATQVLGIMPTVDMYEADGTTPVANRPPGLSGNGVGGGGSVITGFQVISNGVGQRVLTAGDVSSGTIKIKMPNASAVFKTVITVIKISAGNFQSVSNAGTSTVSDTFGLNPAPLSYTPSGYGFTFAMTTGGATVATWPLALKRTSVTSPGSTGNNGQAVFVAVSYEKLVSGSSFDPASYTLSSAPFQAAVTSAHLYIKRP